VDDFVPLLFFSSVIKKLTGIADYKMCHFVSFFLFFYEKMANILIVDHQSSNI